jgi:hypothetical protein
MSLSYAGIDLIIPTAELAAWIEANISPSDVYEFAYRAWPGINLTGMAFPEWMGRRPVKLNTLYWPTGASRWAVGHFLCSEQQLALIRPQLLTTTTDTSPITKTAPAPLIIKSEPFTPATTVGTLMWMLPPRPLAQIVGLNGFYLITLVDDRYYWWSISTGKLQITEGTTLWVTLFQSLVDAIEAVFPASFGTSDPFPDVYLKPSREFTVPYEVMPIVLDAVLYNVGLRLVRKLGGSTIPFKGQAVALNATSSRTLQESNTAGTLKMAGGLIGLTQVGP